MENIFGMQTSVMSLKFLKNLHLENVTFCKIAVQYELCEPSIDVYIEKNGRFEQQERLSRTP